MLDEYNAVFCARVVDGREGDGAAVEAVRTVVNGQLRGKACFAFDAEGAASSPRRRQRLLRPALLSPSQKSTNPGEHGCSSCWPSLSAFFEPARRNGPAAVGQLVFHLSVSWR